MDSRRDVRDGIGGLLPGGAVRAPGLRRWVLDGREACDRRQFRRFVRETKYVTVAERPLDPKEYPDADPELLVPGHTAGDKRLLQTFVDYPPRMKAASFTIDQVQEKLEAAIGAGR